jgi:hypothetical protein
VSFYSDREVPGFTGLLPVINEDHPQDGMEAGSGSKGQRRREQHFSEDGINNDNSFAEFKTYDERSYFRTVLLIRP